MLCTIYYGLAILRLIWRARKSSLEKATTLFIQLRLTSTTGVSSVTQQLSLTRTHTEGGARGVTFSPVLRMHPRDPSERLKQMRETLAALN